MGVAPSHWGYGGPPPGNFENFNSIWGTLVKSRGSFMQKETTIKEKNCTCIGILSQVRYYISYYFISNTNAPPEVGV